MNKVCKYITGLLILLLALPVAAAPIAYSINSDNPDTDISDSLYRINLSDGSLTRIAEVLDRSDIEGLAFDMDGKLWGINDDTLALSQISTTSGKTLPQTSVTISKVTPGNNDFGMTFTCANVLYVTSVTEQSLYRLDPKTGDTTLIGTPGSLGTDISAIASFGSEGALYGLSNNNGGALTPNLYSIDTETGVATLVGPLGSAVSTYNQAGLSFDEEGNLWALTDRSNVGGRFFGSEVLRIDITTGTATLVATTSVSGFESLAITAPPICGGTRAQFRGIPTMSVSGVGFAAVLLMLIGVFRLRP